MFFKKSDFYAKIFLKIIKVAFEDSQIQTMLVTHNTDTFVITQDIWVNIPQRFRENENYIASLVSPIEIESLNYYYIKWAAWE